MSNARLYATMTRGVLTSSLTRGQEETSPSQRRNDIKAWPCFASESFSGI